MNPNDGNQGGGRPTPQTPANQQEATANVLRSQIYALYGDRPTAAPQEDHAQSINAQRAAQSARLASTQPLARQQYGQAVNPQVQPQPQTQAQSQPLGESQAQAQPASQAQTQNQPLGPQNPSQPVVAAPSHQAQQSIESSNPYDRTHTRNPQPQADQWKSYHSAWQNYYQKYYEAYYTQNPNGQKGQTGQAGANSNASSLTQAIRNSATADSNTANNQGNAANQASGSNFGSNPAEDTSEVTQDQALKELREKLLNKVQTRAKKIRKSRHFVPIAAAFAVVLVFLFLQYNRVLLATVNAYVSPGAIDPQNIVVKPNAETEISSDPRLIIPKINVDVPTVYGIGPDHNSQMKAMESGVAHFAIPGANSRPGEIGNTVLSGHSSNDLFDGGDYKFIFAQLDKLNIGDTIYANYESVRYTYVITKKEVVRPSEVGKLVYPTDKPIMTLITCTPLGTSLNRLLVTAEQISPSPSAATSAPAGSGEVADDADSAMPGNSPTLLERLFGAR